MKGCPLLSDARRVICLSLTAIGLGLVFGCAGQLKTEPVAKSSSSTSALAIDQKAVEGALGVRVKFHSGDYYTLSSPRPDTGCAGDAKTFYPALDASPYPLSLMDPYTTVKPAFLKNVSVDLSDANHNISSNEAYNCSYGETNPNVPKASSCSVFDSASGIVYDYDAEAHVAVSGYGTDYYALTDAYCTRSGPIAISDPAVNKLLAGGVYFDIDRAQLGEKENLLLSVTHMPLGALQLNPDGSTIGAQGAASFKVHLIRTGLSASEVRLVFQPRYLTFANTDRYPMVVETLSILAPPTGQLRQDQIVIPLSLDPAIDRIRIERYSGSGVLIDATLYRMGPS